jgi:predicted Zn-dependent protease
MFFMLVLAAMLSSDARAGNGGQAVSAQCWINGKLVGGFPLNKPCPGTEGGGGRAVIMGPPVIVWRRPSAEGSQMAGLAPVDSKLAGQLGAIADTPITLRQKGEFAMKNGDLAQAKLYLEEASRRDPQDPRIQQSLAKLRGLFDSGTQSLTVPRLKLPEQEFLKPMPASTVDRFMGNREVRELRKAEIISYNRLANADAALNAAKTDAQAGKATQKDVDQAQLKLNTAVEEFKKAEAKLKEKIYVLDK